MLKRIYLMLILLSSSHVFAQDFTSYFTGDTADVSPTPTYGVCMMGGATENDEAMKWFLNRANGGDVVVLRASGSDGYNDYFFNELGVTINSVETLVINNTSGALDPYVLQQVENAEAIWFAGGDQYNYVTYFKDNEMEDILNAHINTKQGVIGGTSAGMAILGGHYFDAANGTVTSQEARENPYDVKVSLGHSDFLEIPLLENVITDTHYDDPDRRMRQMAFMARIITDENVRALGLACEEFTSICIDADGIAYAYGDSPNFEDYVYFVQPVCEFYEPDVCTPGENLEWETYGIRSLKIAATNNGDAIMDLNNWEPIAAFDSWERWSIVFDVQDLVVSPSGDPECYTLGIRDNDMNSARVTPNPFSDKIELFNYAGKEVVVYNIFGKEYIRIAVFENDSIRTESWPSGIYFLKVISEGKTITTKLIKY